MPKKESSKKDSKGIKPKNNTIILISFIVLIAIVMIISNGIPSGTGSAVRGGGSKKPDLVPYGSNLQSIEYKYGENSTLLARMQVGIGVGNVGGTRAKESILEAGVQGDSLGGVKSAAFVLYTKDTNTFQSASTTYYNLAGGISIGIIVNPLQAGTGEVYTVHFMNIPIPLPLLDGTPTEQKFTFYGIADATSVISESNENNNNLSRSYILRCAYDPPGSPNPFCCVKRVDPLSTRYTGVRYCEDFGIY